MPSRKAKIARLAAVVVILGSLVVGTWWWRHRELPPPAAELVLYGNVDIRQVQLAFNGAEHVEQMLVREGERVKKGQLLATLHTGRLKAALADAQAQMEAQQQVLAQLEAGTRPEEVRKARADTEAARVEASNAGRTYRRLRNLRAKKLASDEQADNARAAAEAARARLNAAEQALALAVAGPRQEDIAAARATLRAYQAKVNLAKQQLDDARLLAPHDGVIQNRILEPGDMASPDTPVYTLALTDPLWVRAYVEEPDLGRLRPEMEAEVSIDSYPDRRYPAWIGYISPTAEFTPKTVETTRVRTDLVYQTRVYVCGPHEELRLGMPATVHVALNQAPPAGDPCPQTP